MQIEGQGWEIQIKDWDRELPIKGQGWAEVGSQD